jgi:phage-related protein
MTELFTWLPSSKPTAKMSQRTRSASFGDGYTQEVADGLNTEVQTWNLNFTGSKERTQEIIDFLRLRKGYQSFYWTPPFGVQTLFKCKEYTPADLGGGQWSMSLTFTQSFQP